MLEEDLDDSALICKSLIPKRKALQNINPKNSKQIKLTEYELTRKTNPRNEDKVSSDILSKEKVTSSEGNEGESSSYFSKKISTCPLCLKPFKSDSAYSAHMKQCAKSHKMTTQQLLEALELQKKQIQERRAFGLGSQSLPSKKPLSKKKTENKIEPYDLALGLALSKSLTTCESKACTSQETTLKEFGFTSKSAGIIRKKEHDKRSILKERTAEERQRIIVEKVAVVLLDDDGGMNLDSKKLNGNPSQRVQVSQLWSLGESDQHCDWYVTGFKTFLLSNEEGTPEKNTVSVSKNISSQISELNLPQKEFNESWKKMINNSIKSDLMGRTKDNQDVYLHSLVLFTRCPEVLETDFESVFQKFNLSTILMFLEYLYCGTLNNLISLEIDNLLDLSMEINFKELVLMLDCLKTKLKEDSDSCQTQSTNSIDNEGKETEIENEKLKFVENKDLFSEDIIDLTQEEDESNAEKSYWSFIQHEKKRQNLEEKENSIITEEKASEKQDTEALHLSSVCKINLETTETRELEMKSSSETGDLCEDAKTNSDCIILSSGSEPQRDPSIPSPMGNEAPYYDPYDNFHLFSEEPFSPVGLNSQSLLVGDISAESLKLSSPALQGEMRELIDDGKEEKKTFGYCSTPVTAHRSSKIKSSKNGSLEKHRKRRSDLSANRILRKSLGLRKKSRTPMLNSSKKSSAKKIRKSHKIAEALANSVLLELSKSSIFQRKNFVEITPLPNREEFGDTVTPSPNYSIMGETLIKEQLTRYGLKKNLAKNKAKKILRHIYEELHPLYNTETGKIVKMLPSDTPKTGRKGKKPATKNTKTKKSKKAPEKISKNDLNSSKESQDTDETISPNGFNSDGSEFEDLNETLTQSMPSNPLDLPSAFCEFLQNNPDYHQKILLYEPIWLEELQKSLKESYKKHFKMSDLMDYLDQKCVTFRSEAQAKKLQKRYQKKETSKKESPSS